MALLLGIDTGGTYTDAVLFEEDAGVVADAKSLTTREDYAIGVGNSISKVISKNSTSPDEIGLVSLSTTLATNALVEGQGGRVCLVMIGFDESALDRNGLREALDGDPVIFVKGGHNGQGDASQPLDEKALGKALASLAEPVSAFAVASMFAIRNPEHEIAARNLILTQYDTSVTCSHELSSKLDGPRRALTSVLNARLINLIHHLIAATEEKLKSLGIHAPLMVVQGDGALISAELAKLKPIETILSGPAASLVGAAYLSQMSDAIISDIGGTTTDIAILQDGNPRLDAEGATVGGWRTMVEAVDMYTVGLGGDSEVQTVKSGLEAELSLGPKRLVPVSLLAVNYPDLVHKTLDAQLLKSRFEDNFCRFALMVGQESGRSISLNETEQALIEQFQEGPISLEKLIKRRRHAAVLDRLVSIGLVQISGLTPSDAAHVLGLHKSWDQEAAIKATRLFSRQKNAKGLRIAETAEEMSQWIFSRLVGISCETLLIASLEQEPFLDPDLASDLLSATESSKSSPFIDVALRFKLPVVGLGASAHVYYPDVAKRLGTTSSIPKHAGVANAIGAVVGQVRVAVDGTISPTENDLYRLYHSGSPMDFATLEEAAQAADKLLGQEAQDRARDAGAGDISLRFERKDNTAMIDGRELFVESLVKAVAFGRPRIALS
ncbi:MAG: hydantoinase/oxoprolinase family protein [Proteobacteria bacterium]|nr:hydantoinase/oxoprolinase family protein [Pseudomonadota bacterium]